MRLLFTLLICLSSAISVLRAQGYYYQVKFPDDKTVFGCGAVADTVWPVITKLGNCSYNVAVSVQDQVFKTNASGTCYKILRKWKLLWWCNYNPQWQPYTIINPENTDVGPTVFAGPGAPDGNGYIQYTQVIKVRDTDLPVFLDCPTQKLVFCDYTGNDPAQYNVNYIDRCEGPVQLKAKVTDACSGSDVKLSYRLFLDLDGNGSMETYVYSSAPTAWPIQTSKSADTISALIQFPTGFGLPYGKHKIEWVANDNCGNEQICKYEFEVKDCKAPTVVCLNGLSINIMPTGMITIPLEHFLLYATDNCTPSSALQLGMSKAASGNTFPANVNDLTFDCSELGPQSVRIWARDASGNAGYCQTYVNVQDNMGSCPPSGPIAGSIVNGNKKPVPGVQVKWTQNNAVLATSKTDANGQFSFVGGPFGCDFNLIPFLNTAVKQGVTALDALLAAGYVAGSSNLSTPYQMISADVDYSGKIDDADVNAILRAGLGLQDTFAQKTTWRFVADNGVMPDTMDTQAGAFAETQSLCLYSGKSAAASFTAIKLGDINGSFDPSDLGAQSRDVEEMAFFTTADRRFYSGEQFAVTISMPEDYDLAAVQLGLNYSKEKLMLKGISSSIIPQQWRSSVSDEVVKAGWVSGQALNAKTSFSNRGQEFVTLEFQALSKGYLSQNLWLDLDEVKNQAVTPDFQMLTPEILFLQNREGKIESVGQILKVWPNPAIDRAWINVYLPEDGQAGLQIFDASGRLVEEASQWYSAGYHTVEIPLGRVSEGLAWVRMQSLGGTVMKKIAVAK